MERAAFFFLLPGKLPNCRHRIEIERRDGSLDLRNHQITVRELLSNPGARSLLQREFPMFINSPMLQMAQNMTLQSVLYIAKGNIPQSKLQQVLKQLECL